MAEVDPLKIYNVHEAKTHFSRLIDRAHDGEEVVIAKAGVPWVKVVPYPTSGTRVRKPGRWPELRNIPADAWFDPLPDDELDAWEGKYSNVL